MSKTIYVCPKEAVESVLNSTGATHLISLMSPDAGVQRPASIPQDCHLDLRFNDISTPQKGLIVPGTEHVEALLKFVQLWQHAESPALLIHCWFGISRSPAAAFIAACALQPDRHEAEIARELRTAAPEATPNARLIAVADDLLKRKGRMASAIRTLGRGKEAGQGQPFKMAITNVEAYF